METAIIGIGGLSILISQLDRTFRLEESYRPFLLSYSHPEGHWRIHREPIPSVMKYPHPSFFPPSIWEITRRERKKEFRLWIGPGTPSLWKAAVMDTDCTRGEIWIEKEKEDAVSYPLFVLDLLLFAHFLLSRGGVLIHAAAVKIDGWAYLFPAASGGGKSTWSDLLSAHPGWMVLGEDMVIVRKSGDRYQAFGTPWNSRPEYRVADHATLRGVYFLHHDRKNCLAGLQSVDFIQELLQATSLPFPRKDELDQALAIIEGAVQDIPAYYFGFRPEQSAVEFFNANRI